MVEIVSNESFLAPGGRAPEVEPQAGDADEEDLCGRPVRHHQPRGHQGLL